MYRLVGYVHTVAFICKPPLYDLYKMHCNADINSYVL